MIFRNYVACATCDHAHTARIGVGHAAYQEHRFACANCGETVVVGLRLDQANASSETVYVENARKGDREGTIVNLDPEFPVPVGGEDFDFMFPRLRQSARLVAARAKQVDSQFGPGTFERMLHEGVPQQPSFVDEWRELRKVWSLARNGRHDLSLTALMAWAKQLPEPDPPQDLKDWLYRFAARYCGSDYGQRAKEAMDAAATVSREHGERFAKFAAYYWTNLRPKRRDRYFDIFRQHFEQFSEFGQVWVYVSAGRPLPAGFAASSQAFDATKMFYGNAYEVFTDLVETLALINNMASGRPFREFATATLADYHTWSKPSRLKPFEENAPFARLAEGFDNHLRNASHHVATTFDATTATIRYAVGRSGTAEIKSITYTEYLTKCCQAMSAIMAMLALDSIMEVAYPDPIAKHHQR